MEIDEAWQCLKFVSRAGDGSEPGDADSRRILGWQMLVVVQVDEEHEFFWLQNLRATFCHLQNPCAAPGLLICLCCI